MGQKYEAPKGCDGVSLLGEFYATDESGIVTIPDGIRSDIESHGFRQVPEGQESEGAPTSSILDGKVAGIIAALPGLDDPLLAQLLTSEQSGRKRKGVIDAIQAEQAARVPVAGA